MKAAFFYSTFVLAIIGCSSQQNIMTSGTTLNNPITQPAATPSNRVRYRLDSQNLPSSSRWKSTPVIVDINHDGILDLAAHPRLEHGARVWLGNAKDHSWTDISKNLHMDNSCGGGLELGDFNKDGRLDLAVADHCEGVFVYLGTNDNTWQPLVKKLASALAKNVEKKTPDITAFNGAEDLALGDVNEDGFLDIVYAGSDEGGFTVFLGDGTGKHWKETKNDGLPSAEDPGMEEDHAGWAFDVQLIDMNNDKHLDIVSSYYSGPHVWLGDGKGHWTSKSEGLAVTSMTGIYRRLSVADINGDGLKDLAIANFVNGAESYLQKPDGSWQGPIDIMPQLKDGAAAIALGDLDNDGHIDAVIGGRLTDSENNSSGLHIAFGDGKGHWQFEQGTQLPVRGLEEVWGISLADLNGDKRLDLIVTTGTTSTTQNSTHETIGRPPAPPTPRDKQLSKFPHLQVWLSEPLNTK